MTLFGRDSSHYTNYLSASQASGLGFHTSKLTDGDHYYEDPTYKQQTDRARALGVPVLGSYHVLWGNRSLSNQAAWWVQRTLTLSPDARLWEPDCEKFGYNGVPTIDQVNAFGDLVCAAAKCSSGAYMPYCPKWVYGDQLKQLRYRNLWNSSYGTNPAGGYAAVYPGDNSPRWSSAPIDTTILQYGSNTDIGDANAYRGTLAQFLALIGAGGGGSSMTQPAAKANWDYVISSPSLGQSMSAGDWIKYAYSGANSAGAAAASSADAVKKLDQLIAGTANPDTAAILVAIKADGDATRAVLNELIVALRASAAAVIQSLPPTK